MSKPQTPPKESAPIIGRALRLIAYELQIIAAKEKEEANKPAKRVKNS